MLFEKRVLAIMNSHFGAIDTEPPYLLKRPLQEVYGNIKLKKKKKKNVFPGGSYQGTTYAIDFAWFTLLGNWGLNNWVLTGQEDTA